MPDFSQNILQLGLLFPVFESLQTGASARLLDACSEWAAQKPVGGGVGGGAISTLPPRNPAAPCGARRHARVMGDDGDVGVRVCTRNDEQGGCERWSEEKADKRTSVSS
jgi:hypothetical protein